MREEALRGLVPADGEGKKKKKGQKKRFSYFWGERSSAGAAAARRERPRCGSGSLKGRGTPGAGGERGAAPPGREVPGDPLCVPPVALPARSLISVISARDRPGPGGCGARTCWLEFAGRRLRFFHLPLSLCGAGGGGGLRGSPGRGGRSGAARGAFFPRGSAMLPVVG